MNRQDAQQLLSQQNGNLLGIVYDALSSFPVILDEMEKKIDVVDLSTRSADYQVTKLNHFFFRYLSKFEGTLRVRQQLSSGSPTVDWLMDFHNEVVPLLNQLR